MKKFILFFCCFSTFSLFAQNGGDTATYPYWWSMMQDKNVNFFNTQKAFEIYWADKPYAPHSGFKVFKRWEYFWQSRVNPDGTFPPNDRDIVAYKKFLSQNNLRAANGNFIEKGPKKLPNNNTGQPNGLGRVNGIAFHPTNANIIYIGAPQGGVWKTTDNGVTWSSSGTDNLPSLGASSIAIDSANPMIMYLGTGDRDAGDANGIGVYKSTNGGVSWSASNAGITTQEVARILINPIKNTTILAATSQGIYKSYNSGVNWSKKTVGNNFYKEMCYRPGDSAIVYATQNGAFYRSVNGGETWTQIISGFGGGNTRMVIAVSKANPNKVYVVCCNSLRRFNGFYSSSDNGLNFSLKASTPNILGYEWNGTDTTGQAEYDLALCVNPLDSNNIFVGGINVWSSLNGGVNWLCKIHWTGDNGLPEIHADQHIFEINPLNNNVYFGNDGGLYYSSNFGNSVTDISNGLAISQIYKLSQNPLNPNSIMNGYQDNGTSIFRSSWSTVIGGDGMECIIDPIDTTYLCGSLYYGDIRRKVAAGNFVGIAKNGLNGITEQGAWVTPYALQPLNNNRMIIGYKNIWRSNNVKSSPPTWTRVTNNGGGDIDCIEFSEANPNNVYYYRSGANLFRTTDISLGSPVWDSVATPININSIESHPTDNNRIFICGQNKVYRSSNRGGVWTDITGNLPNTSMNNIVMDKYSFEGLYVSTDVGMYYRDSTMANWILYNVGFPTGSRLTEAEIYYHPSNSNLSQITAATYGRGTWQSDLYMTQTQPIVNFTASDTAPCTNGNVTLNDITSTGSDMVQWTITPGTFTFISGNANSKNPVVKFNANGNYNITLYAIKYGKGYNTITKNAFIKVGTSVTINLGAPSKNNFCAGDSALISAIGATNYLWSSGKFCSDSTAGTTYLKPLVTTTFVVTGYNGTLSCGDTESVTITVKPAPAINVVGITTICSLQTTSLVANGVNTYTWSPNTSINTTSGNTVLVNPTSNITYTVSGPGVNGCTGSKAVPITVNPRPKILIAGSTTICVGGIGTTLTATGAGNYAWTPPTGLNTAFGAVVIANPLNNITYSVVGNQGFCLDTATIDIKVVASALVTILPDKSSVCLGDSTNLNLKGCITYIVIPTTNTFFKNDSTLTIFPIINTTYTIEGTISPTCKDTKAQFISVNPKPNVGLSTSKTNINLGDSTVLSATGAKNYFWSPSTGLKLINDSTVSAKPIDTTTYKVIGTNIFNCGVEKTVTINVIKLSSIGNIKDEIKIYPNPTSSILFIQMKDIAQAEILNLNGKRVNKFTLNIGQNQLDLSSLSLGTYLLKIYTKHLQTIEYKIVKE